MNDTYINFDIPRYISTRDLIKSYELKFGKIGMAIYDEFIQHECWFDDAIRHYAVSLTRDESAESLQNWLASDSDSHDYMNQAYENMRVFSYDFIEHIREAKKLQIIDRTTRDCPDFEDRLMEYTALLELENDSGDHKAIAYIPESRFREFLEWLAGVYSLHESGIIDQVIDLVNGGFFEEQQKNAEKVA